MRLKDWKSILFLPFLLLFICAGQAWASSPTITSLSPTTGAVGASVTITGTNFGASQGTSTVQFNGTTATATSWSATSIAVTVPSGATTGNVVVTVSSVASNGKSFTVVSAPSITSLSITTGAVGAAVTITGTSFGSSQGSGTVSFNGTTASVTSWNSTTIKVTVPSAATTGNVVVFASGVNSNGSSFTVVSAPSITSLSITTGAVGAAVTITGTNFGSTHGSGTVEFNSKAATVTSWSATSIAVTVPSGATTGNVVVFASGVNSNGSSFTVVSAPSITSLSITTGAVGAAVTITGTNFGSTQGSGTVTFNGTTATVTSWSATSIAVTVPSGATTGSVVVFASGVNSNAKTFTVTPVITSLSITTGAVGAAVTITGTGFGPTQGTSTVKFNGTAATVTSWSVTSVAVTVPTGATTGNVVVNTGVNSNGSSFTVVPAPSITSLSITTGAVGAAVTITGTNFGSTQGSGTVSFNGTTATVSSWSATSITVTVPGGATTGSVVVFASGLNSNGTNFTVAPAITSLSITVGAVGSVVTIAGTSFGSTQGTGTVKFNGTAATATSWSATSITVTVPSGATTGNVVVNIGGVNSNGLSFTVVPAPSIASLSITTGGVGAAVTITGAGFGSTQGSGTVSFNGTTASATSWSPTSIAVTVPNGATTGNVVVFADGVNSNGSNFTVVTAPSISSLSPTSGPVSTLVTIAGSNFGTTQGTSTVSLNAVTVAILGWSNTLIVGTVPSGASSGPFSVTVNSQTGNSASFTVMASPLPPGWSDQDISPDGGSYYIFELPEGGSGGEMEITVGSGPAASATFANNTFTVAGSGTGITGTADGLNFVYQPLSGDGTIIARVVSVQGSAQAGVMIRETLDGDATEGTTYYQQPYIYFCDRSSTGASFSTWGNANGTLPYWVELVRSGNTINSYYSPDGVNWAQNGPSQTVTMAQSVYIGLAVSSENSSSLATATFDNVSVSAPGSESSAPVITSLSGTTGPVGSQVLVSGFGFGVTQGGSVVNLNGTPVTINTWNATSINITIPTGATSGPLVVSVAPSMNDSNPVVFEVTSQPLPTPWLDQDVGLVGAAGSATYASGTFTVTGSGQGIGGTADGLNFVYQPLSGDGTIIARVVSVQGSAQAGVMIRETLDGDATEGTTYYQQPYIYFCDRSSTGASFSTWGNANGTLPYWVELVRSGNTINSYYSPDGVNWAQNGPSQTVTMAQSVYIGLAVSSENSSSLATATFDNVSVSAPGSGSPAPVITSLSATTGPVGSQVIISGFWFGVTQGGSLVNLNGTPVTINTWNATSINITIPTGATSGPLVVSVAPSMNDSNPVVFEVTSQPLPTPWLDQDVGLVGAAGSATYASGIFTVNGAGTGITGTADGMHFVYQPLSGDGTIIARVVSVQGSAQAGVMIRETLSANSTNAATLYQQSYIYFCDRPSTGASVSTWGNANGTLPYWVELVRSGNTISSFYSPDGVNWTQNGSSQTVTMAQNVYIGLAVSSENSSSLATATFDNVSISSNSGSSSNPVITSLSPTSGSVGSSITITGTNFGSTQGSSAVTFNGTIATPTGWSSTGIVALVPPGATTGNVVVTVSGVTSNGSSFTVVSTIPTPSITSLFPSSAPVGATVLINGNNFGSSGIVNFNGVSAPTASWSSSLIFATVPLGATSGNVVVVTDYISSAGTAFLVIPPANPSGISVNSGVSGASVTITGSGFGSSQSSAAGNLVFNGANALVTSWSDGSINAQIPTGAAPGLGAVTVTLGGVAKNSFPFTVIPSLAPTPGGASSGGYVVIAGADLGTSQGSSSLSFGGLAPQVINWNSTTVVAQIPSSLQGGTFAVSIIAGGITTNFVNYTVNPGVTTISPAAGQVGTTVTITGTSLGNSGSIAFNGVSASTQSWTNTAVTAQVPSGATSGPVVMTSSGIQTNPINFTVLPAPNPLTSIVIQPASASMLVGDTRNLLGVDNNGNTATGATWTVDNSSLASISTDVPPILTALSAGTINLTATYQGVTAQATWTISSAPLAIGTAQWSLPADGLNVQQIVPAIPVPGGVADLFSIEYGSNDAPPYLVRAVSIDGSPVWSSQVPTLLSNQMADASGGLVVLTGNSQIIKFDATTGQQDWEYSGNSEQSPSLMAVHPNGAVFVNEITNLGQTAPEAVASANQILALDDATGQTRFAVSVPQSYIMYSYNGQPYSGGGPQASEVGPMTIMPDGTTVFEVAVRNVTADEESCSPVCLETFSDQESLYLVTVQTDGASGSQALDTNSAQATSCNCPDLASSYLPGETIPDGQGGVLASWEKISGSESNNSYEMTHILSGSTTTYSLPYFIFLDYMVLGDNNTVFAADNSHQVIDQSVLFAFDANSGAIKWTYQQPVNSLTLVAASDGGGVVAKSTSSGVDTVIDFDPSGDPTTDPLTGSGLSYADGNLWLDPPGAGPATGIIGNEISAPLSPWFVPGITTRISATKIPVQAFSITEADVSDQTIANLVQDGITYWQQYGIFLDWSNSSYCLANNSGNTLVSTQQGPICLTSACLTQGCDINADLDSILNLSATPPAISPLTSQQVSSHRLNDVAARFSVRTGVNLVFTQFVYDPTTTASTLRALASGNQLNVTAFTPSPTDVGPHELGHQFQLLHVGYDASNLMCGTLGVWWDNWWGWLVDSLGMGNCNPDTSRGLNPSQIVAAKKGAAALVPPTQ